MNNYNSKIETGNVNPETNVSKVDASENNHFDKLNLSQPMAIKSQFIKTISYWNEYIKLPQPPFELIKNDLEVRIYPQDEESTKHSLVITKGIEARIGIKINNDFIPIPDKIVESWDKSKSALFEIVSQNVRIKFPQLKITEKSFDGIPYFFFENESDCTANIILELQKIPNLIGKEGVLVVVPNNNVVVVYKVKRNTLFDAIQEMYNIAEYYFDNHNAPISGELFWYKDGIWEKQERQFVNSYRVKFIAGPKLGSIINRFKGIK